MRIAFQYYNGTLIIGYIPLQCDVKSDVVQHFELRSYYYVCRDRN